MGSRTDASDRHVRSYNGRYYWYDGCCHIATRNATRRSRRCRPGDESQHPSPDRRLVEQTLTIDAGNCILRPFRETDVERLAEIANDADVARYMADRFPNPYTLEDARWWIHSHLASTSMNNFAIEAGGELVGGIGMDPLDAERRVGAQFGYWLGTAYRRRGIATAAVNAFTNYAMNERRFIRLEAAVYAPNVPSMRVLERCGYTFEGIMRSAIIKRDEILDAHLYAKVRRRA